MPSALVKSIFYRVLLPAALFTGAFLRPSFISLAYVVLGLFGPAFPSIYSGLPVSRSTKGYLILSVVVALASSLAQFIYQVYEHVVYPRTEDFTPQCNTTLVYWCRQFGLTRMMEANGFSGISVILPEIIVLATSLTTLIVCSLATSEWQAVDKRSTASQMVQAVRVDRPVNANGPYGSRPVVPALKRLSDISVVLFLAVLGALQPSVLNSIYFVMFMIVSFWWAIHTPLSRRSFNLIKMFLVFYLALHFIAVFIYQIEVVHTSLDPKSLVARLVGLSPLLTSKCEGLSPWQGTSWTAFVNAIAIICAFHILILQYQWTKNGISIMYKSNDDDGSSVHEELFAMAQFTPRSSQDPILNWDYTSDRNFGNSLLSQDDPDGGHELSTMSKVSASTLDKQKITHIFNGAGSGNMLSHTLISICSFLLHHCYAVAMLAMMTWALLYHSVFGLVFLVAACVIWLFRNTRKVTFAVSPLLLIYALTLLTIQYVYSLDWGAEGERISGDILRLIGLILVPSRTLAFTTLLLKTGLSLPLFILLRLHLRERHYNSLTDHDRLKRFTYGTFGAINGRPDLTQAEASRASLHLQGNTGSYITRVLAKYWIFAVVVVLILNAIPSPPVFYTVGYFIFWSSLVLIFLASFGLFRATIRLYWTLLILYTSVVIISLYCYQFDPIPKWWDNLTGLSDDWNKDIGLINYKLTDQGNGTFILRLIGPISLFAVVVMQLKFFHDPWVELSRPPVHADGVAAVESASGGRSFFDEAKKTVNALIEVAWRLAEVHVKKIVLIVLVSVAVSQVCALNFVVVTLASVAVCIPTFTGLISLGLCVYLMLTGSAKMVFQMRFVHENATADFTECTNLGYNTTENFVGWLGFHKNSNVFEELAIIIVALLSLAALVFVSYRQRHARQKRGEPEPAQGIVFPDAAPKDFDLSFLHCVKFLLNYGFYKFGLEISMCLMVAVAWTRMDLIGAVSVIWLFFFCVSTRVACRRMWPIFLIYLTVLIPVQYAVFVGLPPEYCIEYPWSYWLSNPNQNDNLVLWLDLASYNRTANYKVLIVDFLLFLAVAAQERVFRAEGGSHPAGENTSIYSTREFAFHPDNPHYDFVSRQRSSVDFFKIVIFMYGHWITLVMVFVAGLGGTSLFALGYLVLAFWMLWQGNNLYTMKHYRKTIGRWNSLVFYTVLVMFCKVALQIMGCVYLNKLTDFCFLRQLFSIDCVFDNMNLDYLDPEHRDFTATCAATNKEAMIGFDAMSFVLLIFQLRILHSWYFQFCMLDFRSELVLSNRGAVLTNQLIEKEMKEQNQHQKLKFDEIKQRTSAIRRRYEEQLQKGTEVFRPETYGQDYYYDHGMLAKRTLRRMTSEYDENDPCPGYSLKYVQQMQKFPAKRAGDYYMFDYDPQTDDLVQPVESVVPEVTPGAGDFDKLDPAQLVHAALTQETDLAGTLNAIETAEKIKDEEQRMIQAVQAPSRTSLHTSVSHDSEHEESEDGEEPSKPLSEKLKSVLMFGAKIIFSTFDWTAAMLNRQSRDHRYVAYVLNKEKEKLKSNMRENLYDVSKPIHDLGREWEEKNLHCVSSESDIERLENEAHDRWIQKKVILRLLTAIGNCIAAHTDIVCYLMVILAHARCCGLISLPLPLLVFFWGTLASPRPSKVFWVVMIAYTQAMILIKFVFQFQFFPWNSLSYTSLHQKDVYDIPRVLGIQRINYFAFWDVALLISLFFHRYMLRRLGLWKDANVSDTFREGQTGENSEIDAAEQTESVQSDEAGPSTAVVIEQNEDNPNNVGIPDPERGAFSSFIYKLFHPKFYYIRDLYPYMFLLDMLCFFIVSFGYSSFGEGGTGDVLKDIQTNRVPLTFVIMLIVITMMIVIDRGLYLRKAVICKLVYQFIITIFMHIWIFFVLPKITQRQALENTTAQILYFVKCVYLLISAWQIRNGYPNLCIGNWITHSYGLMNMVFFKIFMAVPFLFELRTSIDWTWTDTSMPLFDFFNMENFYATIYNIKCARTFEQNFPAPRGVPKAASAKYMMGLPMIIILVLIIWCPLLAFSLLNRIGIPLIPDHVKLTVGLEGYPALYTMDSQGLELTAMTDAEIDSLRQQYAQFNESSVFETRSAVSFLDDYTPADTLKVRFRPESEVFWDISTESLDAMHYELNSGTKPLKLSIQLEFIRPRLDRTKEPTRHSSERYVILETGSQLRLDLTSMLQNVANSTSHEIYGPAVFFDALPPFVIVPNEGEVKPASPLLDLLGDTNATYAALAFNVSTKDVGSRLWMGQMNLPPRTKGMVPIIEHVSYGAKKEYIQITAFVDRVFPSLISKYVQGGIIAMYVAVVLLVGRLLRGLITNKPTDVIITEIPNADYLLKICLDIYLVREARDFVLEQDLFAKLIFLFRSPATLIKWTKFKVKSD